MMFSQARWFSNHIKIWYTMLVATIEQSHTSTVSIAIQWVMVQHLIWLNRVSKTVRSKGLPVLSWFSQVIESLRLISNQHLDHDHIFCFQGRENTQKQPSISFSKPKIKTSEVYEYSVSIKYCILLILFCFRCSYQVSLSFPSDSDPS